MRAMAWFAATHRPAFNCFRFYACFTLAVDLFAANLDKKTILLFSQ